MRALCAMRRVAPQLSAARRATLATDAASGSLAAGAALDLSLVAKHRASVVPTPDLSGGDAAVVVQQIRGRDLAQTSSFSPSAGNGSGCGSTHRRTGGRQ